MDYSYGLHRWRWGLMFIKQVFYELGTKNKVEIDSKKQKQSQTLYRVSKSSWEMPKHQLWC